MVQRTASPKWFAEHYYPVRVRIAVPPWPAPGWSRQIDEMLGEHFGAKAFFATGEAGRGRADAMLFYFLTADAAKAFTDRFPVELLVGPPPPY